jgi:galactokinase
MRDTHSVATRPTERRVELGDADTFCRRVRTSALFGAGVPVAVARAPGRLDMLGGIADYSGGLVLEMPLGAATLVAAQRADDGRVVAVSRDRRIAVDADDLTSASLDELAATFTGRDAWGAYALGPVALLVRECGLELPGLRLLVSSAIPEGKGLGSSAAVEVAVLQATASCLGGTRDPRDLALLAQRAEQIFAGAPCGAMDQMAVMQGEPGRLLAMLCRPAEIVASVPLPSPLAAWAIDSGLPHAVSGHAYRRVRCAAFMGRALLDADVEHLTELELDRVNAMRLPERMLGADFLLLREGVADPLSTVEPAVAYPVRAATLFPLEEHARAREFLSLLAGEPGADDLGRLGDLMYESHAGYARCGLAVPRTDEIVEAVRTAGRSAGLVGARISGGGSGGAVVVLGLAEAEPHVRAIAESLGAGLLGGSSPGAALFGVREVLRAAAPSALGASQHERLQHERADDDGAVDHLRQ